jgi:hypothetical protein
MGRLSDGKLMLDVRTMFPEQMPHLVKLIQEVLNDKSSVAS